MPKPYRREFRQDVIRGDRPLDQRSTTQQVDVLAWHPHGPRSSGDECYQAAAYR